MEIQANLVTPENQELKDVFGVQVEILARSGVTSGQYSSYLCTVSPGMGAPPHRHDLFDEAFFVIFGTLEVLIGDRTENIEAGSFIFLPRGIVHTFRNVSQTQAKFLGIATPGGHDQFFDDVDAISQDGPPSQEDAIRVCEKHGIELVF